MMGLELKADPSVLACRTRGLVPLVNAIQAASHSRLSFTVGGRRIGHRRDEDLGEIDVAAASRLLSELVDEALRPGSYPLEMLLELRARGLDIDEVLRQLYQRHLPFVAEDVVARIEARSLKVFLLGSAGTGVVSAVFDIVSAFSSAGYFARAFPTFDPSKKGAPVRGFGVISRDPILSHAPFETPDVILLFDQKLFPLLRGDLARYRVVDPSQVLIVVNSPMDREDFRAAADFRDPFSLHTVDADAMVRGRRIPPNYAMIGAMLGVLGEQTVDSGAFARVVGESLSAKFGPGEKVDANVGVLRQARERLAQAGATAGARAALGRVVPHAAPVGQEVRCEDGNRAIARAVALVLDQFPSVIAAYPITPQTQIVEHLAQQIADGTLSAESVTPESEHGAGGAVLGAARDRVLTFTATSSQGFALMSEIVHTMAGLRMGNVMISNVVRSLNSPLDVENDHSDLNKVGLDAGFITWMSRDVQQAFDFHLLAYLVSLYAEYRSAPATNGSEGGALEMIPDRSVMLPGIVASEGFEVSHASERYFSAVPELAQRFYQDPFFEYVRIFTDTPNRSVVGTLQLSNARLDTDYQRHLAMQLALEIIEKVFVKFEEYFGRRYSFLYEYNVPSSKVVFVVAGAANGTFEEVARELHRAGVDVGVVHPNVLRPFPGNAWIEVLKGRRVFVYDRDDPFGAVGGRLYTELAGVVNEHGLAATGTRLYSRIYGLGGRTPTISLVRDEIIKALREEAGGLHLALGKEYVGVSL